MADQQRVKLTWHGEVGPDIFRKFKRAILIVVSTISREAKRNTSGFSDTGNLAAHIYEGVEGSGSTIDGKVWTQTGGLRSGETSGYALYVEIGTGIFGPKRRPIKPVRAKMLAWRDKTGKWIFAKQVRGRPATPFMKPAVDAHRNDLPGVLKGLVG